MSEIFETATRPEKDLFFSSKDANDVRLGDVVTREEKDYEAANIVIIGCPTDEGVTRGQGRAGASAAPDAIRREFYRLTPFGITSKIFDFGNAPVGANLEETHEAYCRLVTQFLRDGKRVISLGGGNDISYPHGCAMAEVFGRENWIAINIDAHFDVSVASERNNTTQYRQLLEEKLLRPDYFYEIAYQPHYASPVYYRFLQNLGVNLVSLDQLRSRETADAEVRELVRQKFINHSSALSTFFSFDLSAIRASDAPGVSAPSPIGLRGGEFLTLVQFAAKLVNTKIIEFSELNPNYDEDNRTTQLVAIAMHRFCSSQPRI
ncbi:MAG TPA: formimidoylglutamase [Pyrinomonadaceae bacterium]|jgi:formiminoglutamase